MREPPFSPNALFFFLLFPHPHFAPRLPSAFISFFPQLSPFPLITSILFFHLVKSHFGHFGTVDDQNKNSQNEWNPSPLPPLFTVTFFHSF
uniref:Uncharacterized protein n=1 Tax=Meloidogyne enterolobii TaxID=390850 RepID=A0A6V7VZ12_MELEN|nr:unnamed protein product [Meloidogyne enterolobii]